MSEPLELVIFDCDGVLVDSEPISNTVLAQALTQIGLPTTPQQAISDYKGRHLRDVIEHAEQRLGGALPPGWVERFERDRADEFRRSLGPMPGAADAVRAARAAGLSVCVASQGRLEKTELNLSLTGLRELFDADAVFSAFSVPRGKPFPDLFLYAAAQMGVAPARTLVVEDTTIGVEAALAAGMRAVGFALGGEGGDDSDAEALRAAGADVIHGLAELGGRLTVAG